MCVELAVLSSNLVKLVSNRQRNVGKEGKMVYASSANPSGKGNRGKVEGIGERIEGAVDLVIEADDYVASIQPDKTIETRYEQGVMVSMVDAEGKLIPEQGAGSRSVNTCPVVIRKGLDIDKIMMHLSDLFTLGTSAKGNTIKKQKNAFHFGMLFL